jgi:peptidoglycan/LPS O-acetylase OafA/YrhL
MRVVAFDSLRGLAAMSVVIYHSLLVFPGLHAVLAGRGVPFATSGDAEALLLTVTPPSLLWAGREAVLLFFVLSGFVLALGFGGPRRGWPGWAAFAAKRTFRLLLPCAVVALLLAALVPALGPVARPELSPWVAANWNEPVTPRLVAAHALLLGGGYTLNTPMWTLHHELRISLLFPLLMLLAAAGSAVLVAAASAGVLLCLVEMKFVGTGLLTTLLFVPHFALGALVARHRAAIGAMVRRLSRRRAALLWLGCYLLLTFRWLVPAGGLVCDLANGAGAGLLLALLLGADRARAMLEAAPLVGLGAISYSLYLVHVPVLLALLHLMPDLPPWVPATIAPALSVSAAALLYRLVERPSIGLGRQAAAWVERRHPGPLRAG